MAENDPTIAEIEAQPALDLPEFANDDAVDLGLVAVATVRELGLSLAVRIVLRGDEVFLAKLGRTGPGNDPWLAGKVRVVELTGEPSLLARLRAAEAGTGFAEQHPELDPDLYRAHGGSVPLRVAGELVGTLTMSGEPDVVDNRTAAEAIRRYLASR